jgi:hypothetical protein
MWKWDQMNFGFLKGLTPKKVLTICYSASVHSTNRMFHIATENGPRKELILHFEISCYL